MATNVDASKKSGGDLLVELMSNTDPATNRQAQLLVDTNVVLELMSFGDLIREGDKHRSVLELMLMSLRGTISEAERRRGAIAAWQSPEYRHRQLRARASILLMWTLAERGLVAAMLGKEVIDLLEGKVSPAGPSAKTSLLTDGTSYAFTAAIVHAIHPMLMARGLHLGALTEVNHRARGNKADAELMRLAGRDHLPIITNEGYTQKGLSDFKADGSKSLRGLCRDRGIKVYSPKEYLDWLKANTNREAERFIEAASQAVLDDYLRVTHGRSWLLSKLDKALGRAAVSKAYEAVVEDIIPLYRFILFDERDEAVAAIAPPDAH